MTNLKRRRLTPARPTHLVAILGVVFSALGICAAAAKTVSVTIYEVPRIREQVDRNTAAITDAKLNTVERLDDLKVLLREVHTDVEWLKRKKE